MEYIILISAYTNVFQLVGAVILILTLLTRKKKDVCELSLVILPIKGKLHPGVERLLFETYLNRFGFGYRMLGYLPSILGIQGEGYRVYWGITAFIITLLSTWHISKRLVKKNRGQLEKIYNESIGQSNGNIWID